MAGESEPSCRQRRQIVAKAKVRLLAFSATLLKRSGEGFGRAHMDLDELVQVGLFAIMKHFGGDRFDAPLSDAEMEDLGKQYAAYGTAAIKNRVTSLYREASRRGAMGYELAQMNAPWTPSQEEQLLVGEAISEASRDNRLKPLINLLVTGGAMSQKRMAAQLGCSDRTIRNLHGYAKKRYGDF